MQNGGGREAHSGRGLSPKVTGGAREGEWTMQRKDIAVRVNGLYHNSTHSIFLSTKDGVAQAPSVTASPRHLPLGWWLFVSSIITNRQGKQVLCRNFCVSVGAIHESPVFVLRISAGDS